MNPFSMLSFWEKQSLLQYDYIIAGGGIVGLSAAISVKEKAPNSRVLVLERGLLPIGASTRNAGFACIGSLTEILEDLQHMPEAEVLALVDLRCRGLARLRKRLGDEQIRYRQNGSYELINAAGLPALSKMEALNALLKPVLGGIAFSLANEKIRTFGFDRFYTQALVQNHFEGELHTGQMMRCLIDRALYHGIEIKTGAVCSNIIPQQSGIQVVVKDGMHTAEWVFAAQRIAICTNAFAKQFLPQLDLEPGRGQVLLTDRIPSLRFRGVFHFDRGYYYFRELEGRVLLGGGRHQHLETERTTDFELNPAIQQDLEEKLRTLILPGTPFTVTDRWTGIMAFGSSKKPIVQRYSDQVVVGVRCGGMGVAMGSEIGEQLAELLLTE